MNSCSKNKVKIPVKELQFEKYLRYWWLAPLVIQVWVDSCSFWLQERDVEDAAQIMKALAVHRFCNKKVRIIVEVLEPETQGSAVWDQTDNRGIEVICPIKYHYRMIARRFFIIHYLCIHWYLRSHIFLCFKTEIVSLTYNMVLSIINIKKYFGGWVWLQLPCERAIHIYNKPLYFRDQDQNVSSEFLCVRILSQLW